MKLLGNRYILQDSAICGSRVELVHVWFSPHACMRTRLKMIVNIP